MIINQRKTIAHVICIRSRLVRTVEKVSVFILSSSSLSVFSPALVFEIEVFNFLESQIYQAQRQFVAGGDCPVRSRQSIFEHVLSVMSILTLIVLSIIIV